MTEYAEQVVERLEVLHGFTIVSEDPYYTEALERYEAMEAPVDVAVEWLADDIATLRDEEDGAECDICGERGGSCDTHPNDPNASSVCESCASALAREDED